MSSFIVKSIEKDIYREGRYLFEIMTNAPGDGRLIITCDEAKKIWLKGDLYFINERVRKGAVDVFRNKMKSIDLGSIL